MDIIIIKDIGNIKEAYNNCNNLVAGEIF